MTTKFGLWFDFRNPPQWHQPWERLYHQTLDVISHAESLGYDTIWLSEHHFIEDGYLPSVMPVAAAVAVRTKRVEIGTSVLLLPLHNAVRVAEDGAVVDILSRGRFMLGVGQGYRLEEFRAFGVPTKTRPSRFEEELEVIRLAWSEERVNFHGKYYDLDNVAVMPRPLQRPHPPLWVGASADAGAARAGRLGYPYLGNSRYLADIYRRALRGHHSQRQPQVARGMWMYVAEDPEKEWHRIKEHLAYRHNLYYKWFSEAGLANPSQPAAAPVQDPEELRRRNPYVVTDPDTCVERLKEHVLEEGVTHLYFWAIPPGLEPQASVPSIELFARRVMPRLKALAAGRKEG